MFAFGNADAPPPSLPFPSDAGELRTTASRSRRPPHLAYPRRTCPMNLNVALLLLVLAGGIGGTAAVQAALRRSAGRCRGRGEGAVFRVDG